MTAFSKNHSATKGLPVRYVRNDRSVLSDPQLVGGVGPYIDRISAALERAVPFPEAGTTILK